MITIGSVTPVALLASSLLGAGFGSLYFALLRRWVRHFVLGRGRALDIAWGLLRLMAAAAFFALMARWGTLELLAALVGFLAARSLAVRSIEPLA